MEDVLNEILNITAGLDKDDNDSSAGVIEVNGEIGPPQQRLSAFNIIQMLKAQFSHATFLPAVRFLQPPIKKSKNGLGYTASDCLMGFFDGLTCALPAVLIGKQMDVEIDNKKKRDNATVSLTKTAGTRCSCKYAFNRGEY
ncbi:hypothetical protein GQ42DRAFT_159463 [Ramicandelaber brevisporus]|nr:hypothetical protein GQ42DRAFT_159463 [Ramicandelaber brevisporus]